MIQKQYLYFPVIFAIGETALSLLITNQTMVKFGKAYKN